MDSETEHLVLPTQSNRRHPYLSGNFAPINKTTSLTPCTYSGSVPLDLGGGQYVRNGGNPVTNDDLGRDAHWFDGDGMLSGVLFRRTGEKGTAIQPEFVNQFLLTDVYAYARRRAGPVGEHDGILSRPVLPSIATLVNPALGFFTILWAILRTMILVLMSHLSIKAPKMMHDFGASRNHTVILDLPLTLDPSNLARGVPVLSYDSRGKARYGVFPRYRPDLVQWFETNPCVIFHTANCWDTVTHTGEMNGANLQQTSVNLLACRLTSASLVFSTGNLPTPDVKPVPPEYAEEEQCRLYYYNFPLSANDGTDVPGHRIRHQWALSAISFEFPTLSPNHSMTEARYVYGCSTGSASYTVALGKAAKIDYLAKIDVKTLIERGVQQPPQPIKGCVDTRTVAEIRESCDPNDPIKLFEMPDGWFAQEPRFVPRRESERKSEDDGWLLTYVFDESQLGPDGECDEDAVSELWIIDAKTMKDVVARVKLPQRVPYGLHGSWFSEEEIKEQRPFTALRTLADQEGSALSRSFQAMIERWIG
ncbi:hypothetical protein INS49_003248 [Diaporthe citri]|uniref:uncharacterized protein n=1 Tax=Diaporthe citri TaxID=83186 RepID=UPI001C80F360|nr:uncharacterized protein INS49_003248 [Diaporthe citri]KAG6355287.1 hypothetical protein INS49_003248 [Diaporthe citri]